jgi:hypothetical protein
MVRKVPVRKRLEICFETIKLLQERKLKTDAVCENGAVTAEEPLSKEKNQAERKRRVRKLARMLKKPIELTFDRYIGDAFNPPVGEYLCTCSYPLIGYMFASGGITGADLHNAKTVRVVRRCSSRTYDRILLLTWFPCRVCGDIDSFVTGIVRFGAGMF